jgi:hypothetical protein
MGERAQAGPLIYTVFETKWMPQLGEGLSSRVPKSRFMLIRMSIVNSGSNECTAPTFTVIDDNGERYQEVSDGEGVSQWLGFVRRVKPADTLTGFALFDVPLRHYKLEVADDSEEKKAIVDIPLSFSDNEIPLPSLPAPAAAPPLAPK